MKTKGWLILGGTVVILTGLGLWIKTQVDKLYNYDYDVKKIKIKTFNTKQLVLNISMLFKNTSDIYFDIKALSLAIRVNGKYVGEVRQPVNQRINAKSDSLIDFDADITLKNIMKPLELAQLLNYYLNDKSKIVISMNGSVVVSHSFLTVAVPIKDFEYKLTELI